MAANWTVVCNSKIGARMKANHTYQRKRAMCLPLAAMKYSYRKIKDEETAGKKLNILNISSNYVDTKIRNAIKDKLLKHKSCMLISEGETDMANDILCYWIVCSLYQANPLHLCSNSQHCQHFSDNATICTTKRFSSLNPDEVCK